MRAHRTVLNETQIVGRDLRHETPGVKALPMTRAWTLGFDLGALPAAADQQD
jgi:hypothetical protein